MRYLDFIERWFGLSPDGGDGSVEIFIFVLIVVLAVLVGLAPLRSAGNFPSRFLPLNDHLTGGVPYRAGPPLDSLEIMRRLQNLPLPPRGPYNAAKECSWTIVDLLIPLSTK